MRKTLALTLAALLLVFAGGRALAATDLLETGSTLLYPLMNLWVALSDRPHRRADHNAGNRQRHRHLASDRRRCANRRIRRLHG